MSQTRFPNNDILYNFMQRYNKAGGLTKEEQNNYKQSRHSARNTRFLTSFSLDFFTILASFAMCVSLG